MICSYQDLLATIFSWHCTGIGTHIVHRTWCPLQSDSGRTFSGVPANAVAVLGLGQRHGRGQGNGRGKRDKENVKENDRDKDSDGGLGEGERDSFREAMLRDFI